jgi:hypothetical protein
MHLTQKASFQRLLAERRIRWMLPPERWNGAYELIVRLERQPELLAAYAATEIDVVIRVGRTAGAPSGAGPIRFGVRSTDGQA